MLLYLYIELLHYICIVLNTKYYILFIIVIQYQYTAVMYASEYGHFHVIQYLVQQGADINKQNEVRNSIN